jgi:Cu(I)/Ag(I) efflux system protein CusF
MRRPLGPALALVMASFLSGAASSPAVRAPGLASTNRQADAKTYHATGTIRSFGPGRVYVNIAHEEIPGYMAAMTMSFWPQRVEQLDGLAVGDHVEFEFTETEDARRVLSGIRKRR